MWYDHRISYFFYFSVGFFLIFLVSECPEKLQKVRTFRTYLSSFVVRNHEAATGKTGTGIIQQFALKLLRKRLVTTKNWTVFKKIIWEDCFTIKCRALRLLISSFQLRFLIVFLNLLRLPGYYCSYTSVHKKYVATSLLCIVYRLILLFLPHCAFAVILFFTTAYNLTGMSICWLVILRSLRKSLKIIDLSSKSFTLLTRFSRCRNR